MKIFGLVKPGLACTPIIALLNKETETINIYETLTPVVAAVSQGPDLRHEAAGQRAAGGRGLLDRDRYLEAGVGAWCPGISTR